MGVVQKSELPLLLRRASRVIVQRGNGALPLPVLAAFQRNLTSLGFGLSAALAAQIATLSLEEATALHQNMLAWLRAWVGADRTYRPFYPNFPAQVMHANEATLYWNAWCHYWGLGDQVGEKVPRKPMQEFHQLRMLDLGSEADLDQLFQRLASSKVAYSVETKGDIQGFIRAHRDRAWALLPDTLENRENVAVLLAAFLQHPLQSTQPIDALAPLLTTTTDVLRLAVALNQGDVSLAEPTRFAKLSRPLRRFLLTALERMPNRREDLQRWSRRWIRLGERLHPGEFAKFYPGVAADFVDLRAGARVRGFNSQVEQALLSQDHSAAIGILQTRPGELARRLDYLARSTKQHAALLSAFEASAAKVSTAVLLQVYSHFRQRSVPCQLRAFFPKGQVGKVFARTDTRAAIEAALCRDLANLAERALLERFATRPPLGASYLDPALKQYKVPFALRSASKSLRTLVRGSRIAIPDCQTLRFFTWWKNGQSRVDIDLSAVLYGDGFRYIDTLAYYNLKNFGAHHSGDIVDAPEGASEFIDVDLIQCRNRGVRWVIMVLSSYSGQPYCDLPECFAGWMARKSANSGEIYEPRTVVDRIDLSANTRVCIPIAFDLQRLEALWCDIALTDAPRTAVNVHNNLAGLGLMLRALTDLRQTDLHTLFDLHIRARGQHVNEPDRADTVFAVHRGIQPHDLPQIASAFL